MRSISLLLLVLFFSFSFLSTSVDAQRGNNKGKKSKDILSEEYYTQLGSNIERLHKLRAGSFIQKNMDTTGTLQPWYVNGGEDSVMLYSCVVGDPKKDGYWIYHHQFMSNMPDMPLYTALEHIEAIDRDTFVGQFYKCPVELSLEEVMTKKNAFKEVEFDKLEKMDEKIHYWKVDYTEFHGFSEPYFQSDIDREKGNYHVDFYRITMAHMRFRSLNAKSKVSNDLIRKNIPKEETYRTHLMRVYPEDVALFAEFVGGKKKR
jgi:hypothetical protein